MMLFFCFFVNIYSDDKFAKNIHAARLSTIWVESWVVLEISHFLIFPNSFLMSVRKKKQLKKFGSNVNCRLAAAASRLYFFGKTT